jgi:fatty-acyl-CoA synthase
MIIPEIRAKAVNLYGTKEAVVCGDKRFTYRDFDTRVNALSHLLNAHGIRGVGKVAKRELREHYWRDISKRVH